MDSNPINWRLIWICRAEIRTFDSQAVKGYYKKLSRRKCVRRDLIRGADFTKPFRSKVTDKDQFGKIFECNHYLIKLHLKIQHYCPQYTYKLINVA
jgi:hypothetical protein